MKIVTVEKFYYLGDKIEKGTPMEILDIKEGFSRTGILFKGLIKDQKIQDWMDIGIIFSFEKSFTVPRDSDEETIEKERKEKMSENDYNLVKSWKDLIRKGEKEKVIKNIVTRITSNKFGL